MDFPQCSMKKGAVDFPKNLEEQCQMEGKHFHDRWPKKPLCCAHFDAADKIIRLMDNIGEETRKNWFKDPRPTIVNLRVLDNPFDDK